MRLYGNPSPIHRESFTSWLLRSAATHTVSVSEIAEVLLNRDRLFDWDIGKHLRSVEQAAKICVLPQGALEIFRSFGSGFLSDPGMQWVTRSQPGGRPIRRFCVQCLANNPSYYRQTWRLCS